MKLIVPAAGTLALLLLLPLLREDSQATLPQTVQAEDAPPGSARETPTIEEEAIRTFMVVKLKSSQEILAGLTSEDFKAIEKGGQELITMSLASTWQVYETPTYKKDSQLFREQAQELVKAARAKKLDQCSENYFQVIRSCVNCHETVRKSKLAGLPAAPVSGHGG